MTEYSFDEIWNPSAVIKCIARSLGIDHQRVEATIRLLDDGNTIPFIARYRKEVTRGLDERKLRDIQDELEAANELCKRKVTVLNTINEAGLLSNELRETIIACDDRQKLEDIYAPYKPRRRTRAAIARERGLQKLADILLKQQQTRLTRRQIVQPFINPQLDIKSIEDAISGAGDIVAETWSDRLDVRELVRGFAEHGVLQSKVRKGKTEDGRAFENYFDHSEPITRVPSHRLLAMKRGESEGILRLSLKFDEERLKSKLARLLIRERSFVLSPDLWTTLDDAIKRLMVPAATSAVMKKTKQAADSDAIQVFSDNLRQLLLAAPAGSRFVLGIDPGFRTGCKVAVVDDTGKFCEHATIYPTPPRNDVTKATEVVTDLIRRHSIQLIAIGNGTASRETKSFVDQLLRQNDFQTQAVVVSESGASVYSASETARDEFPELDVTVRGAISIARRLQDPLSELVKIEPKAIGVGQYQHDVDQNLLLTSLEQEVQSCVNSVGVNVNTASTHLLSYVAGIGPRLAGNLVKHRTANGPFLDRDQLKSVTGLGERTFLQCAGFLRIPDSNHPLDNSGVHPESYHVAEQLAEASSVSLGQLIGNNQLIEDLKVNGLNGQSVGKYTLQDVLNELSQPGRDPRAEFQVASFSDSIHSPEQLSPGMVLEGVITNVTRFGAFTDIGVHQDGLIHISQMANHFVNDPSEIVSVGDIVKVTVMDIDLERKRIALSLINTGQNPSRQS